MSLDTRNDELDEKLVHNPIDEAVASLMRADSRRRRQVAILAFSIVLDLVLTVGLFVVSVRTQHIAEQADNNKQALLRNCETGNEARANNKKLWGYILSIPSTDPSTPERDKRIADFKQFIDTTFAPRDCSKIE